MARTVTSEVASRPDIQGGTPVFAGTRVPVETLFDFLEDGYTVDDFVREHPTVSRTQAIAVLEDSRARFDRPHPA